MRSEAEKAARKAKAIRLQQEYEGRVSAKAGRPMRQIKLFVSAALWQEFLRVYCDTEEPGVAVERILEEAIRQRGR